MFNKILLSNNFKKIGGNFGSWTAAINKSSGLDLYGKSISVSSDNSIYTCGYMNNSSSSTKQAIIMKFDDLGVVQYQKICNYTGCDASGVAVSSDGSVYMCGNTSRSSMPSSLFISKFNSQLNLQWNGVYEFLDMTAFASSITISQDNFVYVCGQVMSGLSGLYYGMMISKYSSDGNQVWANILEDYNCDTRGTSITTTSNNEIYVCGVTGYLSEESMIVVKINSSGELLWQKTYKLSGRRDNVHPNSIVVAPNGNLYICATTEFGGAGNKNIVVINLDQAGNIIWQKAIDVTHTDLAFDITVDKNSGVYICGNIHADSNPPNSLIVKFNSNGTILWSKIINSSNENIVSSIKISTDGSLYICGDAVNTLDNGGRILLITKLDHNSIESGHLVFGPFSINEYTITVSDAQLSGGTVSELNLDDASGFDKNYNLNPQNDTNNTINIFK